MSPNDNDISASNVTTPIADPHGHAALLLVESLIHGLLARSIISIGDAIDIVETAVSVQIDVAEALDENGAPMWRSHTLLSAIAGTLKVDCGDEPTEPYSAL